MAVNYQFQLKINAKKAFGKQSIINLSSAIANYGLESVLRGIYYVEDNTEGKYTKVVEEFFVAFLERICGASVRIHENSLFVNGINVVGRHPMGRVEYSPVRMLYLLLVDIGVRNIEESIPRFFYNEKNLLETHLDSLVADQSDIAVFKNKLSEHLTRSEEETPMQVETVKDEPALEIQNEDSYFNFKTIDVKVLSFDELFETVPVERQINSIDEMNALAVASKEGHIVSLPGFFRVEYGVFYAMQIGTGRHLCMRSEEAFVYFIKTGETFSQGVRKVDLNRLSVHMENFSPWFDPMFVNTIYDVASRGISPKFLQEIADACKENKNQVAFIMRKINQSGLFTVLNGK